MAEIWTKTTNPDGRIVYEATDTIIVKKVSKENLLARKAELQAEIAAIDSDLTKINLLG